MMDWSFILAIAGIVIMLLQMVILYVTTIRSFTGANGALHLRKKRDGFDSPPASVLMRRISPASTETNTAIYAKAARDFIDLDSVDTDL